MNDMPARAQGVDVHQVVDGYVVYDEDRDRVHYLNHTAAVVLELCTGSNTREQIVGLLGRAYELPEPPAAEVARCLAQLDEEGLIA